MTPPNIPRGQWVSSAHRAHQGDRRSEGAVPTRAVAGPGRSPPPLLPSGCSSGALNWRAFIYVHPPSAAATAHPQRWAGDPTGASSPVPPGLAACLSPHCNHPSSPAQAPPLSMCGGLGPGLAGVQLQEIGTSPDHSFLFGDSNQRKTPPLGGGNGPQSLSARHWALGPQRPSWPSLATQRCCSHALMGPWGNPSRWWGPT